MLASVRCCGAASLAEGRAGGQLHAADATSPAHASCMSATQREMDMAELIVIGYDSVETAEAARKELFGLSKEYLVEVGDAVVAARQPMARSP